MGDKQSKGAAPATMAVQVQEGSGDVAAGTAAEAPPQLTGAHSGALKIDAPLVSPGNEGEGESDSAIPSESEILAKLVAHLGQCKDQRMPLAEMRAGLPASLQRFAEDTQAVVTWLARFEGLIQIVGEPGQEQVVLDLGGGPRAKSPAAGTGGTSAAATPEKAPEMSTADADTGAVQAGIINEFGDDESLTACTVQLRGLPFRAQVNDIKVFLGEHVAGLSTKEQAIRLLLNRDGRPSGFARVQFATPESARAAREALHKQQMGDRYVEVLACTDRAGKARHRRAVAAEAETALENAGAELVLDSATEAVERERVLQECRDHMRMPGRQQLLLSMLGIALSPQARTYLRRLNLGLKHFLARFPGEFRVEGPKGCEQVIWCPNGMDPYVGGYTPDAMMSAEQMSVMMSAFQMTGEMPVPPTAANLGMMSPTPQRTHGSHCMATPSNWGTPGSGHGHDQANDSSGQTAGGSGTGAGTGGSSEIDQTNPYSTFSTFGWPPPWAGAPWGPGWPGQDMPDMDAMGVTRTGKENRASANNSAAKRSAPKADTAAASRSHAHLHPQSHPFAHKPPAAGSAHPAAGKSPPDEEKEADAKVAAVRLRGLPFSMSVQDVYAFFSQYDVCDRIADGPHVAQLLPKANGRPSGQARVQMRSRYDAEVVQQALHNQWIGGRYIEVFVYGDETEEQANDFNAQLGYQPNPLGGSEPKPTPGEPGPNMSGFPNFPPMSFPGSFPGASPIGAPPWANMFPPGGVPAAGGAMPGGQQSPELGTSLDTLFSFLYTDQPSAEGSDSAAPRNAVQV